MINLLRPFQNKPARLNNNNLLISYLQVGNLKDDDGKVLTFDAFCRKFNVRTNFVTYYSVISAIPKEWKTCECCQSECTNLLVKMSQSVKPSKFAYNKLMQSQTESPTHLCNKWNSELQVDIDLDGISNHFNRIYMCTVNTKLRNFQFRLLHRIMGINSKLCKWGIVADGRCDLCKLHEETYVHLFRDCRKV